MVLPELPPGEHFWQNLSLLTEITGMCLYVFRNYSLGVYLTGFTCHKLVSY